MNENVNNAKKILNKRIENNTKTTTHNDIETSKIVTISTAPTYFTISTSAVVSSIPNKPPSNYDSSYKSSRRSSVKSPKQLRKFVHSPSKHDEKQIPDGLFAREKDSSTPFLSATPVKLNTQDESKQTCYNYRTTQLPPKSAPINSARRPVSSQTRHISSAASANLQKKSSDKTNLPEDLQPITISITRIDDQDTGHSIKVRKYYDRQALRIKKLNITSETNKMIENKKAAEYYSNLKAAVEQVALHKKSNFKLIGDNFNILNQNRSNEKPPDQIKIESSIDEDYLNNEKYMIKNDDNDLDISLRKNSNTKATLSQEIKFNNQEIEKLTSKINNHLDELNQSSSSSSSASNQKKPIPKSPHSSFDLNALNDEIDHNLSETDEDKKYLSKSIEITENNRINDNNNNNLDINMTSQMKEESLYDFTHTTLDNFDDNNNNNNNSNNNDSSDNHINEKDHIDINNKAHENNFEEINNVVYEKEDDDEEIQEIMQQSTFSIKDNYYDLNQEPAKVFCDDSELILRTDKKHYTSYADVDIETNIVNADSNIDIDALRLISQISNSPVYNKLDIETYNNNPNYSELNLTENKEFKSLTNLETQNNEIKENNVMFYLNEDEPAETQNQFEVKNPENYEIYVEELSENQNKLEIKPIIAESNSIKELECINNELKETVVKNEVQEGELEDQTEEQKEDEVGNTLNVEHEVLNESHDSSINIKNKEIFIILTEKIRPNSSEVNDNYDFENETNNIKNINNLDEIKSSEKDLIEKQKQKNINHENKPLDGENILDKKQQEISNKVDKGLEKVTSLNKEEYKNENIILNNKLNYSDFISNKNKNLLINPKSSLGKYFCII